MDLLISTCPTQSCGLTQDFVLGCLYQHWTEDFILNQRYLNLNPDDFNGGSPPPMFYVVIGKDIVNKCEITKHGFEGRWPNLSMTLN